MPSASLRWVRSCGWLIWDMKPLSLIWSIHSSQQAQVGLLSTSSETCCAESCEDEMSWVATVAFSCWQAANSSTAKLATMQRSVCANFILLWSGDVMGFLLSAAESCGDSHRMG